MEQLADQPSNSAWIGIASIDNILGINGQQTQRRHGQLVPFCNEPETQVFVWKPDRDSWAPELWVAPSRRDYRSLYKRFIEIYWPSGKLKEVKFHVDHLFPKGAAAKGELSHVRTLAIPGPSNISAGTLEKQMVARNVRLGVRTKQTRMATLYSLGKAVGYVGYTDLDTSEGRRRIAAGLMHAVRQAGAPKEITDSSLEEELLTETLDNLR